jgi:hypothetical protein
MSTPNLDDLARMQAERDRYRGGNGAGCTDDAWPPMQRLPDDALPSVPTLPPELLPEGLRAWLVDAAERMQVPLELVATPALVFLGGLIGRRLVIRPKRHDDWQLVPNLWGATIARPGFLKTPAQQEAQRFLSDLAADAHHTFIAQRADVDANREVIETQIAKLKREAASKDGAPESIRERLRDLVVEHERAVVTATRYYTNDPTVEKLGELLVQNPAGLILVRDELAGWLRTLEKPGREGDREFYLEAWNGTQPFSVDRVTRGTLHVPALAITVCGTMQPGKLRAYVMEALAAGRGADGLLQRFQLLAWPDVGGEWVNVDRLPDHTAREMAAKVYRRAAALPGPEADQPSAAVRFDDSAQQLFDEWRHELERRLRSDEFTECPAYESHVAKYRKLMPAVALMQHVADGPGGGFGSFGSDRVGLTAAQRAAALVEFYDAHARRVYAPELARVTSPSAQLAAKIQAGAIRDGDSVRAIGRRGWSGLKTSGLVEQASAVLAAFGWVRLEETPAGPLGGRRSRVLRLHPVLRETEAP